jgi:hypothetical protein
MMGEREISGDLEIMAGKSADFGDVSDVDRELSKREQQID